MALQDKIRQYSTSYHQIKSSNIENNFCALPDGVYFLGDGAILALPRDNGDSRYPYGQGGFNFWAYASGYMHCNDGLFSPVLRAGEGQEPKIAFFAGLKNDQGSYDINSLLSVPMQTLNENEHRYTVFEEDCVYYFFENDFIFTAIRVFVNENNTVSFTITIENLKSHKIDLLLSSYFNPYIIHALSESGEDRWFREAKYLTNTSEDMGKFIIKTNEDLSRTRSLSNYAIVNRHLTLSDGANLISHEETTSRLQYVGSIRGSLTIPTVLQKGTFGDPQHVCAFTQTGIAGDILKLTLDNNATFRCDYTLDCIPYCEQYGIVEKLLSSKININETDSMLLSMAEKNKTKRSSLAFSIKSNDNYKNYVSFFECLKKQVEFCSFIKGYVQLSPNSLIGIRDVFQALEGVCFYEPEDAKKKMLEALSFVFTDGRCPRQYSLPSNKDTPPPMDLRQFIDQGVWVISTIITYLQVTGDFEFLNEKCGYYELIDEKINLVQKSDIENSVFDHMISIMNYLIANIDDKTGCVKVLFGDWNDALDGLGVSKDPQKEFGNGVSVMVSLQVYQNLNEMISLLTYLNKEQNQEVIKQYTALQQNLAKSLETFGIVKNELNEKRIVHGWGDERSYLVGSFKDSDGQSRYGLTSNAFWVISDMYNRDMKIKDTIITAFSELDSKYGMKTFTPHFELNAPGVGRIPKLPAGTAENGATYIHATVFGIMALFKMGCPKEAWKQIEKIMPFNHEHTSCSPFILPNSYGFNEDKCIDGESMADWQTGSSNVLLKVFIKQVFGVVPQMNGVYICPSSWNPFDDWKFSITIRGCKLNLSWQKGDKRTFTVNEKQVDGIFDMAQGSEKLWLSEKELEENETINIKIVG